MKKDNAQTINAVQTMQDYIAQHLFEQITLCDLAKTCNYSPWYAHRLFTEQTNYSPAEYIRRFRLSQSALRLRDTSVKITDLAYEIGFASVDGYQRAFLREFGCNPHDFAKRPLPVVLFRPYGVEYKFKKDIKEKKMREVKNVFMQVVEKSERKAIIKRGIKADDYWTYCNEVGCDVWGLLTSMKSLCGEPVCMWLPDRFIAPNTSKYVQGVEVPVDYDGVVPEGFDVIDLPACKYLMFIGEPFEEKDFADAIGDLWEAIKKFNPVSLGLQWDNDNPRIQLEPRGDRGYIELLAVK